MACLDYIKNVIMNQILVTPFQGRPYILEFPNDISYAAVQKFLKDLHRGYCDTFEFPLPKKTIDKNGKEEK